MSDTTTLPSILSSWWRRMRHRHVWIEEYYDLRSDEPDGPRTWHGIKWTCACGAEIDGGSCK